MDIWSKHRKKILLGTSSILALLVTYLGGGKLLIYLLLLLSGIFIGNKFNSLMQLYKDYKLSLRVNSIIANSKQYEQQQEEIERLKIENKSLLERLTLYAATSSSKRTQLNIGGYEHGNISSNGATRFGENQ